MTARRPIHPTVFERPHHQRIASVLQGLDGELLRTHACSFGGGTAIALRYGEFRESVDIDFLMSDLAHYRQLRLLATGQHRCRCASGAARSGAGLDRRKRLHVGLVRGPRCSPDARVLHQ